MALMSRATHVLQWPVQGQRNREVELIPKSRSQFGLESATRLHEVESLVIADQHAAVNTFPGLVHTARHTMGVGLDQKSAELTRKGGRSPRSEW